jgi:hypothetical protein
LFCVCYKKFNSSQKKKNMLFSAPNTKRNATYSQGTVGGYIDFFFFFDTVRGYIDKHKALLLY